MNTYALNDLNKAQLANFQPYMDQYGLVTDSTSQLPSGNGVLYTCHMIAGLVMNNKLSESEKERLTNVIKSCMKLPGLLIRSPSKPDDYESFDGYVGLMGADALMNPDSRLFANLIYNYGNNNVNGCDISDPTRYKVSKILYSVLKIVTLNNISRVYNTKNPDLFDADSWFGRRLDLIACVEMSMKKSPGLIKWAYWAISMLGIFISNNNGSDALRFHMVSASSGYGFLTNLVCKLVSNKIKSRYGDMGQLLSQYFNNPNHPLVSLLKGVY